MSGLLGGDMPKQKLPEVKQTRMPRETDPTILEAAKRTRSAAMQRRGRMSTIMTDGSRSNVVGSSGKSLGA
jgi:hypothetical protein